jgi:ATP-dependent RNA helicase RhlE
MLDMGFEEDIVEIQKFLPENTRSMIFSATVPAFIQELATKKLKDPVLIDLVGDETNQVPERIVNKAVLVKDENQMFKSIQSFIESNRDLKVIIFTETKQTAKDFEKMTYARKDRKTYHLEFLTLHGDLE